MVVIGKVMVIEGFGAMRKRMHPFPRYTVPLELMEIAGKQPKPETSFWGRPPACRKDNKFYRLPLTNTALRFTESDI